MPSPFPGMDPYLESRWPYIHHKLVNLLSDAINERLPPDLFAFAEERIAIEPDQDPSYRPDIVVRDDASNTPAFTRVAPDAAALGPVRLIAQLDPLHEYFIRIGSPRGTDAVVVVEVVSPSNKLSPGIHEFKSKRSSLLEQGTHFVEVDLVRRGNWRALIHPHVVPPSARTEYRYTVRHTADPAAVHITPFGLRDPLPDLRVPLRHDEHPLSIPMATILADLYRLSRAAGWVDYAATLVPPVSAEDQEWVQQRLNARQ